MGVAVRHMGGRGVRRHHVGVHECAYVPRGEAVVCASHDHGACAACAARGRVGAHRRWRTCLWTARATLTLTLTLTLIWQ
eukprot:2251467-Prymnesium_polylepis.1